MMTVKGARQRNSNLAMAVAILPVTVRRHQCAGSRHAGPELSQLEQKDLLDAE